MQKKKIREVRGFEKLEVFYAVLPTAHVINLIILDFFGILTLMIFDNRYINIPKNPSQPLAGPGSMAALNRLTTNPSDGFFRGSRRPGSLSVWPF